MMLAGEVRSQLAAVATLRWQLFRNSLRTIRGRLELVSRLLLGLIMASGALGIGLGMGAGAFFFVTQGKLEWLGVLLWSVFLIWQLFPLLATAFSVPFDFAGLLRFPLRYSSFFLLALAYGLLDPATIAGCFWLACMAAGIALARPELLPWTLFVFLLYAAGNLLLARGVFAWLERWLARRRTREILGVIFIFLMITVQFIGPIMQRWRRPSGEHVIRVSALRVLSHALPPSVAATALASYAAGKTLWATSSAGFLLAYAVIFLRLLDVRLRAQFRGESLSEGYAPERARAAEAVKPGWSFLGISGPVAAVFEKELRYLSRSAPMIFYLVMPLVILLLFRSAPASRSGHTNFAVHTPDWAFPVGVAYSLLILTNLVYNVLGADGPGVRLYLVTPVKFRQVLLGKNLAHAIVLALDAALVWVGTRFLFGAPPLRILLATLGGLLFALPINLAAGNLLSLYAPRKFDFAAFGRQRASGSTVFISLGVQILVFGLAAGVVLLGRIFGGLWLAALLLVALALAAGWGYFLVLVRCERIALARREVLTSELCKE